MSSIDNSRPLRVFCPKILFHEHPIPRNESNYFNPTYYYRGDDYLRWRERVENMMNRNSRIWMHEHETGRDVYFNDLTIDAQSLPSSPLLHNTFYNHRIIPQGPQVIDGTFVTVGPKKRRGNLPKATTALLKDWLARHKKHPYPTEEEKQGLAKKTALNLQQISNWFINARRRHLPLMLNSTNTKGSVDIYSYKTAEKAEDTTEVKSTRCHTAKACSRIQMNGAIKKPKHTCRGRRST